LLVCLVRCACLSHVPCFLNEFTSIDFVPAANSSKTKLVRWFYYKEICYDARSNERKIRTLATTPGDVSVCNVDGIKHASEKTKLTVI
jgi:hypothetical protein